MGSTLPMWSSYPPRTRQAELKKTRRDKVKLPRVPTCYGISCRHNDEVAVIELRSAPKQWTTQRGPVENLHFSERARSLCVCERALGSVAVRAMAHRTNLVYSGRLAVIPHSVSHSECVRVCEK